MELQGGSPRLLGGIVKGLKGRKSNHATSLSSTFKSDFSHLEGIFMKNPFPEPSNIEDEHETAELDIGFTHLSLAFSLFFIFCL